MINNPAEQNQIFTVSQITEYISEILTSTFSNIQIEGEISNWRPSSAGHVYFTLKDSTSQISAVMFKGSTYGLTFKPKDGDKVICKGSINVYAPRGNYQILVNKMELAGAGNILLMLEERKKKLQAEGLFDKERKPLPAYIKTIGVVTSSTGAAIHDILNVTRRRNKSVNIIVLPAVVQGAGADQTIVKMIEIANFYNLCDVLIVGRGGGSLEDLLPFSEESVVRAVYNSKIPVISAVGHEIDWALCDYAADIRAATPSQAAELATTETEEILQKIKNCKKELYNEISARIEKTRYMIKSYNPQNLELKFRTIQERLLRRYDIAKNNLNLNMNEKIKDYRNRLKNCRTILENANPSEIFKRGYSMVQDENGNIIRDACQVKSGSQITINPYKGKIFAQVNKTEEK